MNLNTNSNNNKKSKKSTTKAVLLLSMSVMILMIGLLIAIIADSKSSEILTTGLFRDTAFFTIILSFIGFTIIYNFNSYQNRLEKRIRKIKKEQQQHLKAMTSMMNAMEVLINKLK